VEQQLKEIKDQQSKDKENKDPVITVNQVNTTLL